jgi:hypothetical protein
MFSNEESNHAGVLGVHRRCLNECREPRRPEPRVRDLLPVWRLVLSRVWNNGSTRTGQR